MSPRSQTPHTNDISDVLDRLVGNAFALTDARGNVVRWTDEATELLGWTPAEVIGRSCFAAPIACDQPELEAAWTAYLAGGDDPLPPSEVELLSLQRDGDARRVSLCFLPVSLDIGLDVNFFLKALALEMPRDTLIDYLRREHTRVVDALTAVRDRGPEAVAGQTMAGVLVLMHPVSDPFAPEGPLDGLADEFRIEPVDERRSSVIVPGPPIPIAVPDAPPAFDDEEAAGAPTRDRLERARQLEREARRRVAELEELLERAETEAAASRRESERTEAELASALGDRDDLQGRLAAARKEREEARQRYEQAEQEADSLRAQIDDLQDALREVQAEAAQARDALAKRSHDDAELNERIDVLERELAGSASRRAELEAELSAASARRAELEGELAAASARRAELEGELAGASGRRAELEGELANASSRRGELEQALADAERHTEALESDLARRDEEATELREAITSSVQRANQLESDLAQRDERTRRAETERVLAVERADALQAALEQVRGAASDARRWLDGGLTAVLDSALEQLSSARGGADEVRVRLAAGLDGLAPQATAASAAPTATAPLEAAAAPSQEAAPTLPDVSDGLERSSFDAADNPRARIRADGRFVQLNPAFCGLLGYPENELQRAIWPPATDRENAAALREVTRKVLEGGTEEARVETCYLDAHGAPTRIAGTLTRLDVGPDGEPLVELSLDQD